MNHCTDAENCVLGATGVAGTISVSGSDGEDRSGGTGATGAGVTGPTGQHRGLLFEQSRDMACAPTS